VVGGAVTGYPNHWEVVPVPELEPDDVVLCIDGLARVRGWRWCADRTLLLVYAIDTHQNYLLETPTVLRQVPARHRASRCSAGNGLSTTAQSNTRTGSAT
jgi:hypothetical protein